MEYFNLDAIISVGYRVNSSRATRFCQWATRVLREHLTQGYTLNEHRLVRQGLVLNEQGLTALSLLIAESDPKAKDLMVRLTMNLVAEGADPKRSERAPNDQRTTRLQRRIGLPGEPSSSTAEVAGRA